MYKGTYYDNTAKNSKLKRKIRNTMPALAIILIIVLITALFIVKQENRELKNQVKDLTIMITAERTEIQEPARGNVNRIKSLGMFRIDHYCSCKK